MPYNRIIQITTDLAINEIDNYDVKNTVCLQQLKVGLFTLGAVDNLDHNLTSTMSTTSFLGTAISLYQPHVEQDEGQSQVIKNDNNTGKTIKSLPLSYMNIQPVSESAKEHKVPAVVLERSSFPERIIDTQSEEHKWLQAV